MKKKQNQGLKLVPLFTEQILDFTGHRLEMLLVPIPNQVSCPKLEVYIALKMPNTMSLKSQLNQIIKDRKGGVVSINEVYQFCDKNFYKRSNAERRLRKSDSPNVRPVFKDGYIIGYRWAEFGIVEEIIIDLTK